MRFTAAVAIVALSAGLSASGQTPAAAPAATTTVSIDGLISLRRVGSPVDLARWQVGRLHGSRDQLGRQHLRNRDLARRRASRRAIRQLTEREEVEHARRLGARRQDAGVRARTATTSGRSTSSISRWRGAEADLGRRGRRRVRVGARRQVHRLHLDRSEAGGSSRSARRNTASSTSSIRTTGCRTSSWSTSQSKAATADERARSPSAGSTGRRTARQIAFDHRINGDPANGGSADISVVTVADAAVRKLVTQDGADANPVWSPDGSRIAFETSMASPKFFYTNRRIAVDPVSWRSDQPCCRSVRRGPVDRALDAVRVSSFRVRAHVGVSLSPRSVDEGRVAPRAHRSLDRIGLQPQR